MNNRRKREEKKERDADRKAESRKITDPLEPAQRQGHKPSRGAEIDAELEREDEEAVHKKKERMGSFGPNAS